MSANTTLYSLLREVSAPPRFHGNGFTQVDVCEGTRLHVWDARLPALTIHNATIHDHRWQMHSKILVGSIRHILWGAGGSKLYDIYGCNHGEPGMGSMREAAVSLQPEHVFNMAAGSDYQQSPGTFHTTQAWNTAATLMTKRDSVFAEARVACNAGERPTDAFNPALQPQEDRMWQVVEDAIMQMESWACKAVRLAFEGSNGR